MNKVRSWKLQRFVLQRKTKAVLWPAGRSLTLKRLRRAVAKRESRICQRWPLKAYYADLPRLDERSKQEHVTRFQNTHLEKAGFSLSVLDLTRAALAWVEEAFELEHRTGDTHVVSAIGNGIDIDGGLVEDCRQHL